jgi:hypothetical protein
MGGWERNTGEDAYDTLDLATCVTLRPSEKYHRRPACVPRSNGWQIGERLRGQAPPSGFRSSPLFQTRPERGRSWSFPTSAKRRQKNPLQRLEQLR